MKSKVLYVTPSFYPATKYGGPIFSTLYTCKELFKKGVDLEIHTTNINMESKLDVPVGVPVSISEMDGNVVNYHDENIRDKFSLGLILSIIKKSKCASIIHTQSIFSLCTPISILSANFYKKKIVVSPRGSLGEWCLTVKPFLKKIWIFIFFKPFVNSIYWHVTSEQEREDVLRCFPTVKSTNFILVPNGISRESNFEIYPINVLRAKFGVNFKDRYLLSSGRIDKKKGLDFTIKALSKIKNVDLLIMGEDYGEKRFLLDLARDLGVIDRIFFLGHVGEDYKWSFYKHASLFVLNSRHENFGNVYLEALRVGTPIIASENTPWSFVKGTPAGDWVKNDPDLIASSIKVFLEKTSKPELECKKIAEAFYWDEIASKFILEYDRILNVD